MVDTEATLDVLKAQLDKYPTLEKNIDFLSKFSQQSEFVDFAGRLSRNDKGDCTYNFGKHKGKSIQEVQAIEPGYYSWFISPSTDFPLYTKKKLKEEMEKIKQTKSDTIESGNLSLEEKLNALKSKFTK
jgi:DNA polymerase-3 subunit epsilon